jgi:hypothetical protein
MNIIQYFKLENLTTYLKRTGVEKVIVHPEMEDEIRQSKLTDIIDEKNIICFSPEEELEKQRAAATKSTSMHGKKQTEGVYPATIIRDKLKELQEEGEVDFHKVARLGSKMTDFAKLDEYTPRIHKLQYTPKKD